MIFLLGFPKIRVGGSAARIADKCIFLNFRPNFRQNFDKILKKSRNFFENFEKIVNFSLIFLQIFCKLRRPGGSAPGTPHAATPLRGPPLVDLTSPQKKIPAGANDKFLKWWNYWLEIFEALERMAGPYWIG